MRRAILIMAVGLALTACTQVKPGHVGVRVDNLGSNAGVENRSLGVGYYWTGFAQAIYEYPIYTQTYNWTVSRSEGAATDEAFHFQSKEGLSMSADVAVSLHVDPAKAPILFQKYRTDMDGIIAGPVRNAVRDAIVRRASGYGVEEIYGPKKAELASGAETDVRNFFAPFGLVIERLYWTSNVNLPDQVREQIEGKIAAEQNALKEQANVAVVQARAQQQIAQAQGDAQATNLQGAALRANPEVLRLRAIEKWDGRLPQVTSGATPFINLAGEAK
jgi:regulator of protease activity HflC (stomatin/prohibitin superfamily)